jgi:hypothetical protein
MGERFGLHSSTPKRGVLRDFELASPKATGMR